MVDVSHKEQSENWLQREIWEWIKALLIAFVLVAVMRWLLFTPTIVSGPSMEPNFHDRQRLIVNKLIYHIREPRRGEVIVFHAPEEKDYIKRVIALPGESVRVEGDEVYINGQLLNEPYIASAVEAAHAKGTLYNSKNFFETPNGVVDVVVPEGTVFVMGDNRSNSKDSRMDSVGFVPMDKIVGRSDLIFWPLKDLSIVHHPKEEELGVKS